MKKSNVQFLVQLAAIVAIIVLMAFTPVGYIRTPFLTVTLITIPVAIGAMRLGAKGGAICGLAFGLTSFYTALTAPSAMMAAFMAINPALVAILCIIPRLLDGFLCGLIFNGLKKATKNKVAPFSFYVTGVCCPVLNTILFMGTLVAFFYNCEFVVDLRETLGSTNPIGFIIAVVGIQAVIEAVSCAILSGSIGLALAKALKD